MIDLAGPQLRLQLGWLHAAPRRKQGLWTTPFTFRGDAITHVPISGLEMLRKAKILYTLTAV
ncbi:hypothetical protein BJX65DRAFT_275539 [Aspergillus insuetus]